MDKRPFPLHLAAALLAACGVVVPACGGNVVVDDASSSTTGSVSTGGPGDGSAACSNLSSARLCGGVVCDAQSTISNGCQTDATCNGQPIQVACVGNGAGSSCICRVNGTALGGTCDEATASPTLCSPTGGCCAALFGW